MDEDIFGKQLKRVADELAAGAPGFDVAASVDRGIRRARLRTASLAASGLVVAIVLTLVAAQLVPAAQSGAPDPGSFATGAPSDEPPIEASPTPIQSPSASEPSRTSPTPAPSEEETPTPAAEPTFPPQARCEPVEPSVPAPDGIEVELSIDKGVVGPGDELPMDLVVRNTGATPVEYSRGGQRYDFWIEGRSGSVWRWSWRKAFTTPFIVESIPPGEQETASEIWDQSRCAETGLIVPQGNAGRPPPGTYTARAMWMADEGGWFSNPVEFVVV